MSGGLAALLDDIAALAKLAAASVDDVSAAAGRASAKAAGVVVDDTAVTPRYVTGFQPQREVLAVVLGDQLLDVGQDQHAAARQPGQFGDH